MHVYKMMMVYNSSYVTGMEDTLSEPNMEFLLIIFIFLGPLNVLLFCLQVSYFLSPRFVVTLIVLSETVWRSIPSIPSV